MLKLLLLLFITTTIAARRIEVYNKCTFTTWVGILGPGNPANGGFKLDGGQRRDIHVGDEWEAGRIWARTECDGNFNCATGSCGNREQCNGNGGQPPVTLAEFTFLPGKADNYDISLVDGYNIPVFIFPQGGHRPEGGTCKNAGGCDKDINQHCPQHLAVKKDGRTVACKSGCMAFGTKEECCPTPEYNEYNCHPKETVKLFKEACPTAYSYAFDEKNNSLFQCVGASYVVQFC